MGVSKMIACPDGQSADFETDDVRLLAAVAFMAARSGLSEPAMRIFHGLGVVRPTADFPAIGLVMCCLATGDCQKALQIIAGFGEQRIMESIELRALKAMTLRLLNRSNEATELIATVVNDAEFSPELHSLAAKIVSLLYSSTHELEPANS